MTTAAKSARKSRKNASKPVETTPAEVWYKVLVNGKSCHGGSLEWSLPKDNGDGTHTPGAWHEVEGRLSLCYNGLHVTNKPAKWWATGATAYLCEVGEERTEAETDKIAVRRCRLLKPLSKLEMFSVQVFLEGEAKVSEGAAIASGSATVEASGSATVRASGSATVRAYDSATVRAYDSATVEAYGSATVEASGSATVRAYDSATVRAYDSATVRAYDSATVEAYDSATVEAYGSATVRASGSATVRAYDSATVRAYDSATVEAYDSATVNSVYGTPKVTSSENAVHIDRTRGKPIITTADGTMGVQS